MPKNGTNTPTLLSTDEPAPFRVLNPESDKPLLLACDHASRRFPRALGNLGVDPAVRRSHLACDIGAGALTTLLAERLTATAVLQNYSRLVIDCNRQLLDPAAFLEFGDGVVISGNRNLHASDKEIRAREIYHPYHQAIENEITRLSQGGAKPSLLAIHSFTPVMNGISRAWQIGILWDKDERISDPMIEALRKTELTVGDNEPYSGKAPQDYTIDHHAEAKGLPHVGIEIRQDMIDDDEGVAEMAAILFPVIEDIQSRLFPINIARRPRKQPA